MKHKLTAVFYLTISIFVASDRHADRQRERQRERESWTNRKRKRERERESIVVSKISSFIY